jgi:1-acyl-sn-glycerol-3-phosphate acyltransferase
MENFKIIVKPIKPKIKETDPVKIEAQKEKRRLQREARKNKPKEQKEPAEIKPKIDYSEDIQNINKTLKNLIGFSVDELNEKLNSSKVSTVQIGQPIVEDKPIENKKKNKKKNVL